MREHVCPDCKNVFLQPFRCTTCGAQKLYDATLRLAEQRAERAEAELAAARAQLDEAVNTLRWCAEGKSPLARDYATSCEFALERIAALAGEKK